MSIEANTMFVFNFNDKNIRLFLSPISVTITPDDASKGYAIGKRLVILN